MMILLDELKKIIRQIRGEELMFGYRTSSANQLYLLFCFCGHIYFTDKMHRQVKLLWFALASWYIFVTYYVGLMYALYSDEKSVLKTLYVLSLQILGSVMQFGLPLMCFYCRDNIKKTIDLVDEMCECASATSTSSTSASSTLSPRRVILGNLSIIAVCNFVRLSIGALDVVIFYDEAKLNNYLYYIFFLPRNPKILTLPAFLSIHAVLDLTFSFVIMQWMSLMAFMLLWSVICHNQLILVSNRVTDEMKAVIGYVENTYKPSKTWNRAFRRNLIKTVRKYQKIIRIIDLARKFVQIFCSWVLPVAFLRQVTLLHHGLAEEVPFCAQLTGITGFMSQLWAVYLIFWIGETLQSSVSAVSFAVYSTPWYWSTKVRQDLHIFLSCTQKLKNFPIIKVHPLRLHSLAVYLNCVASSVNVLLRKVTRNT